jgi:hypothetical protein
MNELEIVYFSIFLDNLGWETDEFDLEENLLMTGICVKVKKNFFFFLNFFCYYIYVFYFFTFLLFIYFFLFFIYLFRFILMEIIISLLIFLIINLRLMRNSRYG